MNSYYLLNIGSKLLRQTWRIHLYSCRHRLYSVVLLIDARNGPTSLSVAISGRNAHSADEPGKPYIQQRNGDILADSYWPFSEKDPG